MSEVKGEGREEVFTPERREEKRREDNRVAYDFIMTLSSFPIEEFTGTSTKTLGLSLCAQPSTRI